MISIIIPVYNEEKYINRCLTSLVTQKTKEPFEVVIVDNNSTDRTLEIVKEYTNKLTIRVVHEKKQGIIYARSRGFDEARGDIIARIDADSYAPHDWIQKVSDNFAKNIDGLSGSFHFYDGPFWLNNTLVKEIYFLLMRSAFGHHAMLGFNCAITKDAWKKINSYARHETWFMHEDLALGTHIHNIGVLALDKKLIVNTSFRRMYHNFISFVVIYPIMGIANVLFARLYGKLPRKHFP